MVLVNCFHKSWHFFNPILQQYNRQLIHVLIGEVTETPQPHLPPHLTHRNIKDNNPLTWKENIIIKNRWIIRIRSSLPKVRERKIGSSSSLISTNSYYFPKSAKHKEITSKLKDGHQVIPTKLDWTPFTNAGDLSYPSGSATKTSKIRKKKSVLFCPQNIKFYTYLIWFHKKFNLI